MQMSRTVGDFDELRYELRQEKYPDALKKNSDVSKKKQNYVKNLKGQVVIEIDEDAAEELMSKRSWLFEEGKEKKKEESKTATADSIKEKLMALNQNRMAEEERISAPTITIGGKKNKKDKKKDKKDKKHKKLNILTSMFNNAPDGGASMLTDDPASEGGEADRDIIDARTGLRRSDYKQIKNKAKKGKIVDAKNLPNTLDTQMGIRFAPLAQYLSNAIEDFGKIASTIEEDLESNMAKTRPVYKAQQTSNLISAKGNQLKAMNDLISLASKITDLEMKKAKASQDEDEGSDKAVHTFGLKLLKGSFDDDPEISKRKSKDKERKKSIKDDDDDDFYEPFNNKGNKKRKKIDSDLELAKVLADKAKKGGIKFSPHERHIKMEGKYKFIVRGSLKNYEEDWKYVAVNPKTGKVIKDFKTDYPGLMPKKNDSKMTFDLGKMRAFDKSIHESFDLVLK